ncbi:MAG: dihydroorotate dehydrogenase electron transfer subunit [Gemmataceae bacterium]|nr:dihydroorotate dehydrogenase electron transfer subunit [Gemmataceae bacterium]
MTAVQESARVLANDRLGRDTYRIRLECPELASRIRPGQFVMVRADRPNDPLLGRPFALYDTVLDGQGAVVGIDIVYLVVGKTTGLLAQSAAGDRIGLWGPLGNGFRPIESAGHIALIAGGIGQTPFLAYARELLGTRGFAGSDPKKRAERVTVYYGVRSAEYAAGVSDFEAAGCTVRLTSNDGTIGVKGFVTDLVASELPADRWIACGPEPMLHAVSDLANRLGIPCDVSLETPMACGLGICFSCVTKIRTPDGWDYKRVCVDGPVFDACNVVW